MDLSFSRIAAPKGPAALPADAVRPAELSVLLAASAAEQAASPTGQCMISFLRGQDREDDKVHVLARIFGSGTVGVIDAHCLAGSFNPQVAKQLTVGQE